MNTNNGNNGNNNRTGQQQRSPQNSQNSRGRHHHNRNRPPQNNQVGGNQQTHQGRPQQQQGRNPRPKSGGQGGGGRGPNHHTHRSSSSSRPNEKPSVVRQYYQLLEDHVKARKNFYELYFRVDHNKLDKLEDEYHRTQLDLIKFEYRLSDWELQKLSHQVDFYPEDNDYSRTRPEEIEEYKKQVEFLLDEKNDERLPPLFYHTETKQKSRNSYRDDREESKGTSEDYLNYIQSKS